MNYFNEFQSIQFYFGTQINDVYYKTDILETCSFAIFHCDVILYRRPHDRSTHNFLLTALSNTALKAYIYHLDVLSVSLNVVYRNVSGSGGHKRSSESCNGCQMSSPRLQPRDFEISTERRDTAYKKYFFII